MFIINSVRRIGVHLSALISILPGQQSSMNPSVLETGTADAHTLISEHLMLARGPRPLHITTPSPIMPLSTCMTAHGQEAGGNVSLISGPQEPLVYRVSHRAKQVWLHKCHPSLCGGCTKRLKKNPYPYLPITYHFSFSQTLYCMICSRTILD